MLSVSQENEDEPFIARILEVYQLITAQLEGEGTSTQHSLEISFKNENPYDWSITFRGDSERFHFDPWKKQSQLEVELLRTLRDFYKEIPQSELYQRRFGE